MIYPEEFEINIYKKMNPHLGKFSDEELKKHYEFYGYYEGLNCCKILNRNDFIRLINQSKQILEIGPLCFPALDVTKENIKTMDYFSTEELKNNYKNDPNVVIDNIVKVDYVIKDLKYSEVIEEKFDICFSSHNIEHTSCIVTFLQNISSILKPGGLFFLAIPDYRFCFDRFRNNSTILDVLDAFYNKINKTKSISILESNFFTTHNNSVKHWDSFATTYHNIFTELNAKDNFFLSKTDEIINNIDKIESLIEESKNTYIDAHTWKLTPKLFKNIVYILNKINLIDLSVLRCYRTLKGSNEFYCILQKN